MRNGLSGVFSTVISGLSNLLVQLMVAALCSAAEFGLFVVGSTTIILGLGLGRALVGQTDMIRGLRGTDRAPAGASFLLAGCLLVLGALVVGAGFLAGSDFVTTVGLSCALSAVFVIQDCVRFRAFRTERAGIALVSDVTVLILAIAGLIAASLETLTATLALLIWAAATAGGAVVAVIWMRYLASPVVGARWLADQRDLVVPSVGEFALQSILPYLLNWLILALGGYAALAGYRLVQLLFGAVSNFAQGLNAVTLPRIVNSMDPATARRYLRGEVALTGSAALAALAVVALVPGEWGVALFGATWLAMGVFLLPAALHAVVNAWSIPNYSALRLLGHAKYSFLVRAWSVPLVIGLAAAGGALLGPAGIAWGLALAACVTLAIRAVRVTRVLSRLIAAGQPIPGGRVDPGAMLEGA